MSMYSPKTRAEAEKTRYGTHHHPRAYDPARCAESVRDQGRWPPYHQCERKPGYGPDGLYCKQHDPEAVKRRDEERAMNRREQRERKRPQWYGAEMLKIIRQIAAGHNDPTALCREFIKKYDKEA